MQFINDDMDDLFRRAAEEYPLKTDKGDWNKLLAKMKADGSNKKGNKTKYLLFFLLIPLLLICTTYINNDSRKIAKNKATGEAQKDIGKQALSQKEKLITTVHQNNNNKAAQQETIRDAKQREGIQRSMSFNDSKNRTTEANKLTIGSEKLHFQSSEWKSDSKLKTPVTEGSKDDLSSIQNSNSDNKHIVATLGISTRNVATEKPDNIQVTKKANETHPSIVTTKEKKEKKQDKFYFGLQAGPDFSMVKSTNIHGAGYSFGLLAGYNFNKKLALETGLMWDHKYYQSDGKYFNTEKLNWPYITIIDLTGYCNMYEIPLNFRYNVLVNAKRTWFANAGLSSYLMKKESYDYNYKRYGVYGKGSKEYKNTTSNWLSVAHLSIGLQKNLGSIGDLRIEPYLKLPLKGVGIGSMPLRSSGIYLGLTRSLR